MFKTHKYDEHQKNYQVTFEVKISKRDSYVCIKIMFENNGRPHF